MHSFGYRTLISVLLPGSILLGALWLVASANFSGSRSYVFVAASASQDITFATILLLGSALAGSLIASVMARVELHIFDRITPKKLGLSRATYDEQWYCYVESLRDDVNPYLQGKTDLFFFELHCGCALFCLSIACFVSNNLIALGLLSFFASAGSFFLAQQTHVLLAFWRDRLYSVDQSVATQGSH